MCFIKAGHMATGLIVMKCTPQIISYCNQYIGEDVKLLQSMSLLKPPGKLHGFSVCTASPLRMYTVFQLVNINLVAGVNIVCTVCRISTLHKSN